MDEWRSWLLEPDRVLLERYEAGGLLIVWTEETNTYNKQLQWKIEAWAGPTVLVTSDPVKPTPAPDVVRSCAHQMLVRLGTYYRNNPAE
jgi:hypothetical protein